MADISTSPGGSFFAQDFSLESVEIVTSSGQPFNVRSMVVELSFFEDLYAFVTSGYIILKDAVGLVEKLKLSGTEYINLSYGKSKNESDDLKTERAFKIYKIGDRNPMGNLNSEHLTLFFCTEALLLSEQTKVSKSYVGKQIATKDGSGIINNILLEKLKIDPKRLIDIDETYGVYDFLIPRMKPFEAISWLSTYARPAGNKLGADMLFFENKDGFLFKSLQSLYASEPYTTYKYQPKNLETKNFKDNMTTVLSYEIIKSFDSLSSTNSGAYSNRLLSIDPLTRTHNVTDFDYSKYAQQATSMNGNPITQPATNELGTTQTQSFESSMKVVFGNSNQSTIDYIKERVGSVAKDIFIETSVPLRTAQLALANYTTLKISIPGDSSITVGRTIQFNLYSLQTDATRKQDDYFSGKYLVTAVRHVIQTQGVFQTILEISKESSNTGYVKPDESSKQEVETSWL